MDYENINNLDSLKSEIKRTFFSFRNGIVADSIKKLYDNDVSVFGLTLPQIKEISEKYPKSMELGKALWSDNKCRESRLLALYLIPVEKVDIDFAQTLFQEVDNRELAELLPFKILRYLPYAKDLNKKLRESECLTPVQQYCLDMFQQNLQLSQ